MEEKHGDTEIADLSNPCEKVDDDGFGRTLEDHLYYAIRSALDGTFYLNE